MTGFVRARYTLEFKHDADLVSGGIVLARGAADFGHDPRSWGLGTKGFDLIFVPPSLR